MYIVLTGIAATLLFSPPIPTKTFSEKTSGDITFVDRTGSPLNGALEIIGEDVSSGVKPDVNYISWTNIPNLKINFNALDAKSVSLNLRITGNSPNAEVIIENFGNNRPAELNKSAPGDIIKYIEIRPASVSFSEADIAIQYTDSELNGLDENTLLVYHYNSSQEKWSELPTIIDASKNTVRTKVSSFSFFALSTEIPKKIEIIDASKKPISSDVNTYNDNKTLRKSEKTNFISAIDIPENGELEVVAIKTKNVAVKIKLNDRTRGEIILDDYGKKNPVSSPVPGKAVKFVEIGANNITLSSAAVTIHYNDEDLNGVNESTLVIYHWIGTEWELLETTRDLLNNTLTASATSLSPFAIAGQVQINHPTPPGPDCVNCHDISNSTSSAPRVDVSAMNASSDAIHRNLNNNATNTTQLSDLVNKACWGCHTNGTEYSTTILKTGCLACHNRTANLTFIDPGRVDDISKNKVYDHIQQPYADSLYSDAWDPAVTCTACHVKSMGIFNDSGALSATIYSNVSHYATNTSLIKPGVNCSLCHKDPANATEWYANLTRHPARSQEVSFCANCHNNTNVTSLHSQPLVMLFSIHGGPYTGGGFDWENDDAFNESGGFLDPEAESCVACHGSPVSDPKLCENCHLPNTTALFTGPVQSGVYNLRSDINDALPSVYSHINYSNMTGTNVSVPSQFIEGSTDYKTTCYGYNQSTGEGTCHGTSYFNRSRYGGYYAQWASITPNKGDPGHWTQTIDRLPDTTDCLFCHDQSNTTIRSGWGNPAQVNATTMFGNRYPITNDSCYACHTRTGTKPFDFHSSEVVSGGGPGCLGCHNGSDPQNFSDKNGNTIRVIGGDTYALSVHASINEDNASGYGINASCWACHSSTGTLVDNNTHPDRKENPYTCVDCHLSDGIRAGAFNATIISNHYKNGTYIKALDNKTTDLASCIECHENVSGMTLPSDDMDTGLFPGDGIGINGGNRSYYHYGAKRLNFGKTPGSYDYCIYCHRNATGEFNDTFQDTTNRNISSHSLRYNSSTPACSDIKCHNSTNSTLHGLNLLKTDISMPNSSYCLDCHGKNDTGGTNYTGAVTAYKEKHNNVVNCTECHMGTDKRNIHPMTYLQTDKSYNTSNLTSVNCRNCHQQDTFDSVLNTTPPKVTNLVQHSDKPLNGSIWNNTEPYWTDTDQQSMCNYCHGDSRHNASASGRPADWQGWNTINSSITSSSNWCAGCHYQGYSSSNKNYNDMVQTFETDNLSVPPEITNHSSYAPDEVSGYYSHTLSDHNDSTCKECHGKFLPAGAKITEFMHNLSTSSCNECHFDYNYMNNSGAPARFVNESMYSSSPHGSLECQDCHTQGHNNIKARKACEDCHAVQQDPKIETDRHNITGDPGNYIIGGVPVMNITTCTTCHDQELYNNATNNYGPPPKSRDCDYCHTYPDKTYS